MDKRRRRRKPRLNRGNLRDLVILSSVTSVLVNPPGENAVMAGFAVLAVGSLLHFVVKGVLIRNSVLCKDGIYSVVRHPYYLANYIIDSSFCLITGNMYLVFMYPFLFFWAYGPAMKQEEDHLRTIHGERYALFADITPQAFPGPFSLRGFKRLLFGFTALRITPKELNRLSRFWGVAFFLAVLQELRVDALPLLRWSHIRRDWDAMLFLILALLMLTMNLIVPRTGDINQK